MDPHLVTHGTTTLSPIALFIQADPVVKVVMAGLILASAWTWMIIIVHGIRLAAVARQGERFEREFWKAEDIDRFHSDQAKSTLPAAKVLAAGIAEWRRSTGGKGTLDREGIRSRLNTTLGVAVATEIDRLADRLNILATIGSVAPFVGLFGTVWGIMRSFTSIGAQQNTSLAVVAPGISEALFATALGLFAAIPAVVGYNRLTHRLNRVEARLMRFADAFHVTLSRELDQ